MKAKRKSGKVLRFLAFLFIWVVPLAYITYIAIDITAVTPSNDEEGKRIVFSIWSLLILGVLLIAYIINIRKRLLKVVEVSDIQNRPVPAFWRFIQLVEYAVSFVLLIAVVFVINNISNVLYTFGVISLISGTIGYTLLMIDSIVREKYYQEDKILGK